MGRPAGVRQERSLRSLRAMGNTRGSPTGAPDVIKTQKELAEYQEKIKKDKELIETFDKQAQIKLGELGA